MQPDPARLATGTGPARRRLTLAETTAGALPEPMTADEWRAMWRTSALYRPRPHPFTEDDPPPRSAP